MVQLATSMAGEERAAAGAAGAFEFADVVREHQGMVFSIAYHFLRDRSLAEELAQEVFLQLYRQGASLKSPDHVKFWLRRVACHRSIDMARRRGRHEDTSLTAIPEPAAETHGVDVLLQDRLRKLVASLPDTPRLVVILRYMEDLGPEEIGRVLNMPVRTVKSHLQRALATLREKAVRYLGEVEV